MQGVIMLEGPDGCGKTTLARKLVEKYDAFYIHGRVHKNIWKYHTAAARLASRKSQHQLVVVDRNWPSEAVYGPLFRDTMGYKLGERCLDRVFLKMATLHVMCLPENEDSIVRNFNRLKESRREEHPVVLDVARSYRSLWEGGQPDTKIYYADSISRAGGLNTRHDWVRYDWSTQGHDLDSFCRDLILQLGTIRSKQYQAALAHDCSNILGYMPSAEFIFVGEQLGNPYGPTRWPFHAVAESPLFLNQHLQVIDWLEPQAMWTNMVDSEQHLPALLHQRPDLKVITLGAIPRSLCKKLSIPVHAALKHPQYERRFNRNGALGYEYWEDLKSAVQG